jgi:hypothetical protein
LVACPCCLDRGVQSQQIRLSGNAGDGVDDPADLIRLRRQLGDPLGDYARRLADCAHRLVGALGRFDPLAGEICSMIGCSRGVCGRHACLLDYAHLPLGALGDSADRVRDLADRAARLFRRHSHLVRG